MLILQSRLFRKVYRNIYPLKFGNLYLLRRAMSTMSLEIKSSAGVVLLTVEHLKKHNIQLDTTTGSKTFIKVNNTLIEGENNVSRYLARKHVEVGLYGSSPVESSQVDSWLDFSHLYLKNTQDLTPSLKELNGAIGQASYIVGPTLTLADFSVYAALQGNPKWCNMVDSGKAGESVSRWYKSCINQDTFKVLQNTVTTKKSNNEKSNKSKNVKPFMEEGGKFVELPGVKDGEVVVRFPPEASGYLHIGHAKAALLNQYYKDHYKGKLIMRFDDTNPAKENAHYEKIILEDIQLLQLTPDKYSRTSDYFDEMFVYAEQLIRQGDAYVDDTPAEEMRAQRDQRLPSPKRDLSVEENMRLFQEMKQGTPTGLKNCLRAKIDYASDNGCMRDPVLYRCRDEAHVEHGTKYKAYPTYDFACPIVDSVEGVTHAMRTTEYLDRDVQYQWIIKKLGIRDVQIYSYSRLALINTVLSKRKLTYLVDEGFVDGWNDPRFPTVRGVLRRGMTIEGLKEFIVAQGSSKSNVHMEWDKIWAFNKKVIDPVAPRYNALLKEQVVPVTVHGAQESSEEYPKHPKNEAVGKKPVYYSSKVFVEGEDAELMKEGDLVTFINWGNLRITKVNNKGEKISSLEANLELDNKDFKKTLKITWLAEHNKAPFIPTKCTFFENIIEKADMTREDNFKDHIRRDTKSVSDMLGDPCLADLKKGDIIQLQRRGYFICDEPYQPPSRHSCKEAPCILFHIPDGSTAGMMNQGKGDKSNVKTSSSTKTADSKPKGSNKQQKEKSASSTTSAVPVEHTGEQQALFDSIVVQGDKIRNLKAAKASKETITAEVTILKDLKAKYKDSTGREFTPPPSTAAPSTKTAAAKPAKQQSAKLSTKASSVNHTEEQQNLFDSIVSQGDKIRNLKSAGATTEQVSSQVAILKDLKLRYKASTGVEFVNPSTSQQPQKKGKGKMAPTPVSNTEPAKESTDVENLKQKISEQGDKIRQLKSANTAKVDLQPEINILIQLKSDYKELAGTEYKPPGGAGNQRKGKEKKANEAKPKEKVQLKKEEKPESEGGLKKVTRLGLEAKKEDSLHDWYTQVITKAELIEYYDVSGCYILRPWAYGIWEKIKDWFDANIKSLGVENCYFPMFVSQAALEKEKEHIADFAPEVAWVTKSGQSELAEPIAVRPTSETAMYPAYAKWVQSHRDLPLRLNQWCNVVRWEFKHPQPFLRTREFLWQEGHTAFADYEEACKEVHTIVDWYEQIYTDLLAIPVVKGRKTEKEKFAGGVFTITVEAYIQASGRAIQGATSHHLGQNFSRMFDIAIEDPNKPDSKEKLFVYQNCWGITTRTIGVLIMVHGDNKGLVLPPRVANLQVVIVPVGITATTTDETRNLVKDTCIEYENKLKAAGVRVRLDNRENYSPGWKFNHWELKGVPIRIELGPRDIEKNEFVAVRRDTGEKISMKKESFATQINELLDTIQSDMFKKASKQLEDNLTVATSWETFLNMLDRQKIIQAPFCGGISCEEKIKKDSAREEATDVGAPSMGAKSLCIPLKQPGKVDGLKCVYPSCGKPATCYTLFGRSY